MLQSNCFITTIDIQLTFWPTNHGPVLPRAESGGGGGRQRGSVGVRATAERSEAVRGAEGAEKPLFHLKNQKHKKRMFAKLSTF